MTENTNSIEQQEPKGEFLSPPTFYGALGAALGSAAMVFGLAWLTGWTGDWDSQNTLVIILVALICAGLGAFFGYKIRRRPFLGGLLLGGLLAVPVMNGVEAIRASLAG